MPPKAYHRTASSSRLGASSRTNSSTKLGLNLQFTQRDPPYANKQPENPKSKKSALGHAHDAHGRSSPFQRVNSSTRISSKDQLPPYLPSKRAPPSAGVKSNGTKQKAGFTLATSPQDDEDDEDDWVSSESGAATPNPAQESDSDPESEVATPIDQKKPLGRRSSTRSDQTTTAKTYEREKEKAGAGAGAPPARVDDARKSGHDTLPRGAQSSSLAIAATLEQSRASPAQSQQPPQSDPEPMAARTESTSLGSEPVVPRPPTKRQASTRPPSTYSVSSRNDHALRPHPLIRGQSFGVPSTLSKPAPLAPLTVTSNFSSAQISSSSPVSIDLPSENRSPSSTSPTTTVSVSPPSVSQSQSSHHHSQSVYQPNNHRRTSVSSARSVATLPVHSYSTIREPVKSLRERERIRHRTLSTISASSSSAAISSLAHIPVTRPTSPQNVTFPHPSNPVYSTAGMHSLLPPPYLTNHLTVLAHRTPLRESYDRVMRAKIEYRR